MISLRKSLTEIDALANLYQACRECFLAALEAIEKHAIEIEAEDAARHRQGLRQIRKTILEGSEVLSLQRASAELSAELQQYAQKAGEALHLRERDVREILAILAEIAGTITDRSDRYTLQFRVVASELESAAESDSLSTIRSILSDGVGRLRSGVDAMRRESQDSVERLQEELNVFRRRLAQAEVEAATDPLTGLANRREAEKLIHHRINCGRSVCIMLFDLDGFKGINDRYGHVVGDQVLRVFAERLLGQFRSDDVVCRWGGDEFLAVLHKALPDAVGRATAVASEVSGPCAARTERETIEIPVSASVGVAQHQPGETAEELLTRADRLLYRTRGVTLAGAPRPFVRQS